MESKIKEEGILEFKVLTVTKGIFKQMIEVPQKEYQEYVDGEGRNPWDTTSWVGYAIDVDIWFIFEKDGTLKRIRDMELWWVMRSESHPQPTIELRKQLRQVFLK